MTEKDVVEFEDVFCEAETPSAILCSIDGAKHWIPQSQVDADSEVWRVGDEGTLIVTRWIAEQTGLI
jgi:hypothetical protein